jgi:hypothetical protein
MLLSGLELIGESVCRLCYTGFCYRPCKEGATLSTIKERAVEHHARCKMADGKTNGARAYKSAVL